MADPVAPLAALCASIADCTVDDAVVEFEIAAWLALRDCIAAPDLSRWATPSQAHRLMEVLLPGWKVTTLSCQPGATITGPAGQNVHRRGPHYGRAILAATFVALLEIERAKPMPVADFEDLRAAMRAEVAANG